MKCNCIEEINGKIKEATGDPEASLDILFTLENGINERLFIPYSYRNKKKDGTFTVNKKEGKLALGKCPFCGESGA